MISKYLPHASKIAPLLLLILLSASPYLNTLAGSFVYDDAEMVLGNRNVKGMTTLYQMFFDKQVMTFSGEIYRPLRDISYRVDYLIGGKEPFIYHGTNVLLHVLAVLTSYWFIALLTRENKVSFLSAAFFAVHPIHTESVAWIKGRDDILFALFYLLSFVMYLRYEDKAGWKGKLNYLVSLSLFILSLFSKEMGITLPLTIALYQVIFKKFRSYPLLPYLAIAAVYMGLRTYVLGQVAQQEYWGGGSLPTMLTMSKAFAQYLRLSLMPINQCADYFSFPVSRGIDLWVMISFLFLVLVMGLLFVLRNSVALWGGLFFFMALLPVSNIIPIKIPIAERFLYLPLLGFCIAFASGLRKVFTTDRRFLVAGLVFVSIFTLLTFKRNYVWRDEYSLWSDTLRKAPGNARAHYGMGTAYATKGMLDEAIREFKESIRLAPYYPEPFSALGLAYYKKGMVEEAIKSYAGYRTAEGLISYYKKGLAEDAVYLYRKALQIDPANRDARYNLALLYQEQGMMEEAIKEFLELLKYKPDDVDALNSIGLAYFQKGLFNEAIKNYQRALTAEPESAAPYNNIGMVYAVMGRATEAEKWFKKALIVDTESAESYYNLGFLYQNMGRAGEASEAYRKALTIRPDYKEARERLRNCVIKRGSDEDFCYYSGL